MKIKDCWKWAAMDADGEWFFYEDHPVVKGNQWYAYAKGCHDVSNFLEDLAEISDWKDSLHEIVNGELVKHIELKVDDKVMVKLKGGEWKKRYFKEFGPHGDIRTFIEGSTSWSCPTGHAWMSWGEWRLPTEEEL
jgi:hypothetical protein